MNINNFYILIIFTFLYSSSFSQEIIMTSDTLSICSGTFKDPGGDADYPPNQNIEMTLCSANLGMVISVTFNSFELGNYNRDSLSIYDGYGTTGTFLGSFSGNSLNGQTVKSIDSECLTFVFSSDGAFSQPGWEADINCVFPCQDFSALVNLDGESCPDTINLCIGEQINISAEGNYFSNNGDYIQNDTTSTYTWDFGTNQTASETNSSCTYTFPGTYDIVLTIEDVNGCVYIDTNMVNVICGDTCPTCKDFIPSDSHIITCTGTFWDSGFGMFDYQNNENDTLTFCSDNGGSIQLEFLEFDLDQLGSNHLLIFDGPDLSFPLIGNYTMNNPPPAVIYATNPCLTAKFSSRAWSALGTGWQAEISCTEACQEINAIIESNIAEDADGHFVSCFMDTIILSNTLAFPENNMSYYQSVDNMTYKWSDYNGLLSTNDTLEYVFNYNSSQIFLEIKDTNHCVCRDTFILRAECQSMDPQILINNSITTGNHFFVPNQTTLDISYDFGFDPSDACYNNSITHTFNLGSMQTTSTDVFLSGTDTAVTYPNYSQEWLILQVEDSAGCVFKDSVWMNTGCQTMSANLITNLNEVNNKYYTCINDAFNVSVQTSYDLNGQSYTQSDTLHSFHWDMKGFQYFTKDIVHHYSSANNFPIKLEIIDSVGCEYQFKFNIQSLAEPEFHEMGISHDTICINDSINLTSRSPKYDFKGSPFFIAENIAYYSSSINISVPSYPLIQNLDDFKSICLNMEHSYVKDLRMEIECPNGQSSVLLFYSNNCAGRHLGEPCDINNSNTIGTGYEYCFTNHAHLTIDESADLYNHTFIDNDGNTVTSMYFPDGEYLPSAEFSIYPKTFHELIGCPINGDWTFHLWDNLDMDGGYVFNWTLNFSDDLISDNIHTWNTGAWTLESGISADIIQDENDGIAIPHDTGSYYFSYEVTNVAGCSYDTILSPVYVKESPENIEIIGETDVQIDDIEIYYIANNNYNYEWFVDGGTIINTISNDSIQVQWNSLEGSVNVIAENSANCLTTDLLYINSTQIEEINEPLLKVYPNPADNSLFVESPTDILQIQIYSITGKKIYTQEFAASKTKLNISSLSQGQYLIKVINNESVEVVKFIKR